MRQLHVRLFALALMVLATSPTYAQLPMSGWPGNSNAPQPFRPGSTKRAVGSANQMPLSGQPLSSDADSAQAAPQDDIPPASQVLPQAGGAPVRMALRSEPGRFAAEGQTRPVPVENSPPVTSGWPQRSAVQPVAAISDPSPSPPSGYGPANQPVALERTAADGTGRPGGRELEGTQTPHLELEKIAPDEVQVGKPARFELRVRNSGTAAAHDVTIQDEIPQGARLLGTTPQASRGSRGELVWAIGTLQAGAETTVRLELLPMTEGELGSVARVRFAAEASVRTRATKPQLALVVEVPTEVMIGEMLPLKIRVSNPGSGVATDVVLNEHVPAALQHEAGPELEYEIGTLAPGETREIELELKTVKPGPVLNMLSVRGAGQLHVEHRSPLTVLAPALDVALEGPKRRYLDRQASYTVWVSNPGTANAEEVELSAVLPAGLEFVSANNAGQYDPATRRVQWLLEELPPNQKGSVVLNVLPVETGEQPLRVSGSAKRGLSAEKQESLMIEGLSAILFQVADVADPIEVGGETSYEIRVVNQGSKAATNVQIVAFVPGEMRPTAAEGPTAYRIDGQQVLFQPLSKLAPKADTTFRIRVQGLAPGDLRIRVQLTSDDIRTPITKEESTRVYSDR
jgi:uncharacterized repeat protein (TIGR01451 family)